ncbi:Germin-like protein subfamily 1 member 17 [Citrus sinensis]|uniref:Germin-like protein subfamily 1 member 17 n=1 Tax=Citrus sinensis TaxID=2711 RepID=A0ACB8MEL7_CITSI|nr:Germin-like protein subfamily 1 member 17 [Citrus sinensis]
MKAIQFLIGFALLALASSLAPAYDPSLLQDICVAIDDPKDGVFVNGKFCKDPKLATAEDFFLSGLDKPGNTTNRLGVNETHANVEQIPGQHPCPPHIHPRASEILLVLEGTLYSDVFVFPIGLIHFHVNIGNTSAVAYSGLNSQFPGEITIADTIFGAHPRIKPDFLAKAFQLDPKVVKDLENKFGNGN